MKRSSLRLALALVLGSTALAGCGGAGGDLEAAPGWEEPGWMIQVRQENEEYQTAMVSCYAEYGITGTKSMAGTVGVMFTDADGGPPPGIDAVLEVMAEDCNARVPLPEHSADKALDEAAYGRMLDTRECMIAHGYDVPEPPSFATWKDSGLQWAWNPYSAVFGGPSGASISNDDMMVLDRACPQAGPNRAVFV